MDCKTAQQKIMPYIERKLSPREAEDFIEHIRGCRECGEELEVYFTIYYALEQLGQDGQDTFDIPELLERDLSQTEKQIRRYNIMRFYRRLLTTLAAVFGVIFLITAAQMFWYGSSKKTTIYKLFSNDSETELLTEAQTGAPSKTDGETEPQTNRKRQIVITTPETEAQVISTVLEE